MPRGKRRSQEEIQSILKDLETSGQTIRAFASERGLSLSTLDVWRRKDRQAKKGATPELRRVEVVGSFGDSLPFELERDGTVLRIPAAIAPTTAEAMMKSFLSACSH